MMSDTILIVEDNESQRLALQTSLEMRGFEVRSVGDVESARALEKQLGQKLGVMILDMRLEDPAYPSITGADLGLEVRALRPDWPPEFLITSAFSEVEYYRLAVELGVATYLHKEENTQDQVIRHVRGLILRRALSAERPNAADEIRRIAETSRDRSDAVLKFCKQVLAQAFESVVGTRFVILMTANRATRCIGNAGLPERADPIYSTLQGLVHGEANRTQPFVFDSTKLWNVENGHLGDVVEKLNGAAFIPLSMSKDIILSVGFLSDDSERNPLAENALELCKVLGQYLRPAVLEHLLRVLTQLGELEAKRKYEVLRATSSFCLYVGQEQLDVLSDAEDSDGAPRGLHLRRLQSLAEDLRDTGEIIMSLVDEDVEVETGTARRLRPDATVSMAEIVSLAWEEMSRYLPKEWITLEVSEDCEVLALRQDLFIVASRLLQWLARRRVETSLETPHLISARCTETPDGPQVTLEDCSRRLPERLRRQLFFPFSQAVPLSILEKDKGPGIHLPLYLAKMIVEVKYRGRLEDRSDEIEGDAGHRFVISFPKP